MDFKESHLKKVRIYIQGLYLVCRQILYKMFVPSIVNILVVFGLFFWLVIFFYTKNHLPKTTFNIIKLHTIASLIGLLVAFTFIGNTKNLYDGDLGPNFLDTIEVIKFFVSSQFVQMLLIFNVYAIVIEHQSEPVEIKVPNWLTSILCILVPLIGSFVTLWLDNLFGIHYDKIGPIDSFSQSKIPSINESQRYEKY